MYDIDMSKKYEDCWDGDYRTEEMKCTVASVEQEKPIHEKKRQLLWDLVVRSGDSLTDSQRELLFVVYEDVFTSTPDDFGRTKEIRHTIDVGNAPPIRQPICHIPPICRKDARHLLQGILSKGVIKPSTSPWASPIVLAFALTTIRSTTSLRNMCTHCLEWTTFLIPLLGRNASARLILSAVSERRRLHSVLPMSSKSCHLGCATPLPPSRGLWR